MSIWIDGIEILQMGTLVRVLRVASECDDRLSDPLALAQQLRSRGHRCDLLTFGQRLPDIARRHPLHVEYEQLAAMRITTYDDWLRHQASKETRKNVHRAHKKGIEVRECAYDDAFVAGMHSIYNEHPVRQGKPFRHFGKDLETVRRENATHTEQSVLLGAYFGSELVGFLKFVIRGDCASTMQVISKTAQRDKNSTNALIAKAVEICAHRGIGYLQYGVWSSGSLGDFKRYNGFKPHASPRYFMPLTLRGWIALRLRLHQGMRRWIPSGWLEALRLLRRRWVERGSLSAA